MTIEYIVTDSLYQHNIFKVICNLGFKGLGHICINISATCSANVYFMGVHMGVHIWHNDLMVCILQRKSPNVDMTLDLKAHGKMYNLTKIRLAASNANSFFIFAGMCSYLAKYWCADR